MENLSGRILLHEQHGSVLFREQSDDFYALRLFSDELLAPASEKSFDISGESCLVLIPITGDLVYQDSLVQGLELHVGQIMVIKSAAKFSFLINNPFPDNQINFLMLQLKSGNFRKQVSRVVKDFDFNEVFNGFADLTTGPSCRISLGRFEGRMEGIYRIYNQGFFCFVLAGAFEVEGRLLQSKDGLALWNTQKAEFEALSNNALLIVLDLPYICL